jgi:molybdenum cofactor cytidylyltransferase
MVRKKIAGLYLAAGNSVRMGTQKLALPFKESYLGNMGLKAAVESNLDYTIVVTKEEECPKWIDDSVKSGFTHKWTFVTCEEANKGQSISLKKGIEKAISLGYEAVLIMLADQPYVTSKMINEFIKRYSLNKETEFISAVFEGIPRPPVLFTKSTFERLSHLKGDEGARKLIRSETGIKGEWIYFNDSSFFIDIDTMDDYISFK